MTFFSKRLTSFILLTSSFFISFSYPKKLIASEIETQPSGLSFVVTASNTAGGGLNLYKMAANGTPTLLQEDMFPDTDLTTFNPGQQIIDSANGKILFKEPTSNRYRKYDVKTNTFDGYININGTTNDNDALMISIPFGIKEVINKKCASANGTTCDSSTNDYVTLGDEGSGEFAKIDSSGLEVGGSTLAKKNSDGSVQIGADGNDIDVVEDGLNIDGAAVITKNSDGSIQIGADGNDIDITAEGLTVDGVSLITKKDSGEIHIGKNSLITKEEDGVQKLYAKDENDNAIDINVTNGSKLLIDGASVQGQIDDNASNISTNTSNISTNTSNIKNLGEGVAGSTALTAALSALPQTSKESKLSCGIGSGAYSSRYAVGFGCASKVNERVDINAGGSYVFGGSKSYGGGTLDSGVIKAGFVFKLGELNKTTQISMKEKEELRQEISDLKANNTNIISQNKALLARLERLEKVALGKSKSQDLATIKLP